MAELVALPPQIAKLEAGGYIAQPSGTIPITENGMHDVKAYANADVNVQPDLGTLDITENGTYSASTYDKDGFLEVTVDVQPDLVDKTVTENGIYKAAEETPPVDGYRQVEVDVPAPTFESKTATPTAIQFDVEPSVGFDGLSKVTVLAALFGIDTNSFSHFEFGIDDEGLYYTDEVGGGTPVYMGVDTKGLYVIGGNANA